jgi:hypothetical protein
MNTELKKILYKISDEYHSIISNDSIYLLDINIGKEAEKMGYSHLSKTYHNAEVVIPLKHPLEGMKVMIDGRTFVNYVKLEPGIVVPEYVAQNAGITYRKYHAKDSMVRVFA